MLSKKNFYKRYKLLFCLFLLGVSIRLFIFFLIPDNFDIESSEPWSKIHLALQWWQSENTFPDVNFGPLHAYLIISSLKIYDNVSVSPRLISLISGIFLIFPFYYLIKKLFDEKVALLSGVLLIFYPLHIRLSVVSLAMAPFVLFLFLSLYWFFLYKDNKNLTYLIFSAIFLNFAGALRYEGWIFIPILLLFLIKEKKRDISLFSVIALIVPVLIMVLSYKIYSHFLSFAKAAANVDKYLMIDFKLNTLIFGWIITLKKIFYTPVLLIGIFGIIYSFFNKKSSYKYFALIFLLLFIIYEYRLLNRHICFHIRRYVCPMSLLILPYISLGILSFSNVIKNRKFRNFTIIIIALTIASFWSVKVISDSLDSKAPEELKKCIEMFSYYVKPHNKILIDAQAYHPYVIVSSGLDINQFVTAQYDPSGEIIKDSFHQILKKEKPTFILYCFDSGDFKNILDFDPHSSIKNFGKLKFTTLIDAKKYKLYKISYY